MKKHEFVNKLAELSGTTKTQAEKSLNSILEIISGAVTSGETVSLTSFGKFETISLKAHKGHDPRTGEVLNIPESKAIKFRPSKLLRAKLDNGKTKAAKTA